MIEITRNDAKKLFSINRPFFVLPSNIEFDHPTFHRLNIQKDFYCREFPEGRIKEYRSIYCNEVNGQDLRFFHDAIQVLISRTGFGFEIKDAFTKQRIFIVRGGDSRLIQFVNTRFLKVMNAGYLPNLKTKFKFSSS